MVTLIASGRPGRVETALAGLALLMFAEAFLPKLLAPDPTLTTEEPWLLRYLWLPFYGLIAAGLVRGGIASLDALARSVLLLSLIGLAFASALWSFAPDLTTRRAFAVLMTTLLGVWLAVRFDWLELFRLLAVVWLILLGASFVSGLVAPSFAVMDEVHPGAWSGGWWEKNQLGGHASRASLLFAFLAWRDSPKRKVWIASFGLAVLLVLLSRSATSLAGVLLGMGVLGAAAWMIGGRGRSVLLLWSAGASLIAAILMVVLAPSAVAALVGRDVTLTGRTEIWAALLDAINERPWLGHGYQAFWAPGSEARYWMQKTVEWKVPTGHNGWLDLAAALGWTGVVLFALDFILSAGRAVRLSLASPAGVMCLGALAQLALFSVSESMLLQQNSIVWATYAAISVKLAREAPLLLHRPDAGPRPVRHQHRPATSA
jgi:exopolysaccharide production protein ExoQ